MDNIGPLWAQALTKHMPERLVSGAGPGPMVPLALVAPFLRRFFDVCGRDGAIEPGLVILYEDVAKELGLPSLREKFLG